MARPERNDVDYFPFICQEGKKMYYIEETYGNDGFATFVKILRELAKTEFHYLNLSKKTTLMFLSAKCKVSVLVLQNIINDLVELGKFDAELWNNYSIIWCQDFIDSIQDAYKKRNNQCITLQGLRILLQSLGVLLPNKQQSDLPVNPQRKEKDSKVEKRKEKESDFFAFEEPEIIETFFEDFETNKSRLINELTEVLGFSEEKYIYNKRAIMGFVNSQLKNENDISHFAEQFRNYKLYKKLSEENEHSFDGFFGTQKEAFQDGKWNSDNWALKLEKFDEKNNKKTKSQKIDDVFGSVAKDLIENHGNSIV